MRSILSLILALIVSAGVLRAEPFSENYEVMGTLALHLNGDEMILYIPFDRGRNRAFVRVDRFQNGSTVAITAASPTLTGSPGRPMMQVFLAFGEDGNPDRIFLRLSDEQGVSRPLLSDDNHGAHEITEFSAGNDGKMHIGFSATLVRVDVSESQTDPRVIDGEQGVDLLGSLDYYTEWPAQ